MLHAAAGDPSPLPRPERLPMSTLLILALLVSGLLTFGLLFVLLALVLGGPVMAVLVGVAYAVAAGLFLARLVGSIRDPAGT